MPPEEIGTAYFRIRADTRAFAEEARSGVQTALRSEHPNVPVRASVDRAQAESTMKRDLGGAVRSTIGYIGGIFAAEKVFSFGRDVLQEAADVQKAQETIRQEYGRSGDVLEQFATHGATQLGISTAASEKASGMFGALFRNIGYAPEKSAQMTLGLQKVVGALSEVRNVDPTSVLERLNTTLATGSTRGLRSLGVALDSTTVKAEAMRLGLLKGTVDQGKLAAAQLRVADAQKAYDAAVSSGGRSSDAARHAAVALTLAHEGLKTATAGASGTLTVAAKDQAIYSLVTQHLGSYMQEAKQHSGDYAVQQRILNAEWQNAQASIGDALLPVATEFLHLLVDSVQFIRRYQTEFIGLAAALGIGVAAYAAITAATKAVAFVQEAARISSLLLGNSYIVLTEEEALAGAETEGLAVAMEAAGLSMSVLATGGIAIVALGLYELYQHSATAKRIMREVAQEVREGIGAALGWLGRVVLPAIEHAWSTTVAAIERFWTRWGDTIKRDTRAVGEFILRIIRDDLHLVMDVFNLFSDLFHGRWNRLWNDVKAIFRDAWRLIRDEFGAAAGWLGREAIRLGTAILNGIWHKLQELGRDVSRFFTRTVPNAITDAVSDVLHAAEHLGSRIVWGVVHGVGNLGSQLKNSVEDHIKGALSGLNPFSPVEHGAAVYIGNPIISGSVNALAANGTGLQDQVSQTIIQAIRVSLQGAHGRSYNWSRMNIGTPIVEGAVYDPAMALRQSLTNVVIRAVSGALAAARSHFGIHSPSSVWATQLGQPLAEGIAHGMGGLEQMLVSRVQAAARAAYGAAGAAGGGPAGSAASGANQQLGYQMMLAAGWPASQWGALQALWTRESGWNANAVNPSSGAYGIPQSLGHGHPYNLGDARAQIAWGLDYIRARYGSPAAAWAHEEQIGWYQGGGIVPGARGEPQAAVLHGGEVVFTPEQMGILSRRSIQIGQVVIQGGGAGEFLSELDAIARAIG